MLCGGFPVNGSGVAGQHACKCLPYFGGVTRILTPDNLKTGIIKKPKVKLLSTNLPGACEHYGTLLPAPRAPIDKAQLRVPLGSYPRILAAKRNHSSYLCRTHDAIHEKLIEFNSKPFQKKDGNRASTFAEEKPFLLPLPNRPYELATWKVATVQYNYHICTDSQNYSCPYEYIKQKVDVRITKNVVEIFFEGNRIASHPRLHGRPGQYSTIEEHMPPDHQKYINWNGERFIAWAEKIGENTAVVVRFFLSSHKVEQQGYKSCWLSEVGRKYSVQRLEAACVRALFTHEYQPKECSAILRSGRTKLSETTNALSKLHQPPPIRLHTGAEYYKRRKDDAQGHTVSKLHSAASVMAQAFHDQMKKELCRNVF